MRSTSAQSRSAPSVAHPTRFAEPGAFFSAASTGGRGWARLPLMGGSVVGVAGVLPLFLGRGMRCSGCRASATHGESVAAGL